MDPARRRKEPQEGYWASLAADARHALLRSGQFGTVAAKCLLTARDDESGDIWIVWHGLLKVAVRSGRKSVVLAIRGPGDIIGDAGHVTGQSGSSSMVSIGRVEVLRVPCGEFAAFRRRFPEATESLCRTIAERLREADRDRVAAASMNVGQRLARYLLKIVRRYGVVESDGAITIDRLTQSDLAGCVGGSQRTVAGEFGHWRSRDIVSTSGRYLTVHRPDELRRIAGLSAPPP